MAKSQVFVAGSTTPSMNMTPMIDVTFQLIIFFILAGTMASQEVAQLLLHKPTISQAQKPDDMPTENRVIVNITSAAPNEKEESGVAQQAKEISVRGTKLQPNQRGDLVEILRKCRLEWVAKAPTQKEKDVYFIEIRADRRLSYAEVEPVMLAAAEAEIPKMNITALLKEPQDHE